MNIKSHFNVSTPSLNNIGRFHQEIVKSIQLLTIKLTNKVKNDKLSGQVLNVRTGRLRNSIHSKVEHTPNAIKGIVQTNVKYAAVHEYGFKGSVTVKAHLRTIKQAFGKPIAPTSVQIGSFTRTANFPQRSFLRSSLQDMRQEALTEITNAIRRVI